MCVCVNRKSVMSYSQREVNLKYLIFIVHSLVFGEIMSING